MARKLETPHDLVSMFDQYGSLRNIARKMGMTRHAVGTLYKKAVQLGLMEAERVGAKSTRTAGPGGNVHGFRTSVVAKPAKGKIRRFICTSAQNNTKIHTKLWENLQALSKYYDAEIHVARFTYVKRGLGAAGDKAQITKRPIGEQNDMTWDKALHPYFSDARLELAPGLVWCGEMNILPTASNPLSGLQVYTGLKSSIFPHTKIAMQSVATGVEEDAKLIYTTGAITMRNYIQKKAGFKAEFHHCYGALLVEVDDKGRWFCRHLNGDSAGTIYDLKLRVKKGEVEIGDWVDSIYWGDPHAEEADNNAIHVAFGKGGMKDYLRPKADFAGDMLSFKGRNHHELKDPHVQFLRHMQGLDNVSKGIGLAGKLFQKMKRSWCQTYAVNGNHERHIGRWLKEVDARWDAVNAEFWLEMNMLCYKHIRDGGIEPQYLELALSLLAPKTAEDIKFLKEDESVIRCLDSHGGIECGSHGDRGPRGARGSAMGFARMGRKRNIGHVHGSGIYDGIYVAGTFEDLNSDWTRGPSDWSCSHIVTYENGKRAIYTFRDNKYKA